MPKPLPRKPHPKARDAAELLGHMIRAARLERNMTVAELAERAAVSRPLINRVEKGNLQVSIGSVFEIAAVLGVPLFETNEDILKNRLADQRRYNALLRKRAFSASQRKVDDDF